MLARTIPRLAPMFSVVENGKFDSHRLYVDGPMHSILEDVRTSGHSNSDSSSSMRRSSFDWSSSVQSFGKKPLGSDDHENLKLVITHKQFDWHSSEGLEKVEPLSRNKNMNAANVEYASNPNGPARKPARWHYVCNVFSEKRVKGGGRPSVGPMNSLVAVESKYRRRSIDGALWLWFEGV